MEKEQKIVLSRIIASGVLLAASYVSSFPVWLHVVLCATAYFIIGADVICKAIRNLSHGLVRREFPNDPCHDRCFRHR